MRFCRLTGTHIPHHYAREADLIIWAISGFLLPQVLPKGILSPSYEGLRNAALSYIIRLVPGAGLELATY